MKLQAAMAAVVVVAATVGLRAEISRISFADKPRLVRCGDQACFRILVDGLDANGSPADLPTTTDAYRVVDARTRRPLQVFYVAPLVRRMDRSAERPIYSLLLFDLSGSMNRPAGGGETRYEAAVRVLQDFIAKQFIPGVTRWAIVGFHSHNVANGIRGARFAETAADALMQARALERPAARNNTALYSAVDEALTVLKRERDKGNETRLFVFTDGKNEVFPGKGDDPDLLGANGLEQVRRSAEARRIEIIPIGFGVHGDRDLDEDTLRQLAWPTTGNYHYAGDQQGLAKVFEIEARKLVSRVQLTVGPAAADKNQLTERIPLTVSVGGRSIAHDPLQYVPPPMTPVYEAVIAGNEEAAFKAATKKRPRAPSRVLILAAYSLFFLVAWFALPRVIWRGQTRQAAKPADSSSPAARVHSKGRAALQSQSDATRVMPRLPARGLEIVQGSEVGKKIALTANVVTIGTLQTADLPIVDPTKTISRVHCEISRHGSDQILVDRSTNGTFVNDVRVTPGERVTLKPGDRISLAGKALLKFQ